MDDAVRGFDIDGNKVDAINRDAAIPRPCEVEWRALQWLYDQAIGEQRCGELTWDDQAEQCLTRVGIRVTKHVISNQLGDHLKCAVRWDEDGERTGGTQLRGQPY